MAAEDALNDEQFRSNIPTHAIHGNSGRVRVMSYDGRGYFTVLGKGDRRITAHRDSLTFLPSKKKS